MVCMIDARGARVDERVDYWRHVVRDRFGVDADFQPLDGGEFEQSMSVEQLGNVLVGERRGSAFRALQQANSSDLAIACLNLEGHCDIQPGDRSDHNLRPNELLVLPLREAIEARFAGGTRHLFVACPTSVLADQCPEWQSLARAPLGQDVAPVRMLFELAQSMVQHSDGLGAACRTAGGNMLVSLLASSLAARDEGEQSQSSRMQGFHLQRIRNYILTHLCDPQLDAPRIAAGVGLSLRYIHRLFATEPLHLMQWVLEQRLRRCREALQANVTGSEPISQIAYRWGFNDAAHFSRAFRKRFGLSPREVVERARRSLN